MEVQRKISSYEYSPCVYRKLKVVLLAEVGDDEREVYSATVAHAIFGVSKFAVFAGRGCLEVSVSGDLVSPEPQEEG